MKATIKLINLAERLTASGTIGDGMVAEFHAAAKAAALEQCRNVDHDIAIGEHAFRLGFRACQQTSMGALKIDRYAAEDKAWSNYTPPEDLCGGGPSD